jgi:hypothetical protein
LKKKIAQVVAAQSEPICSASVMTGSPFSTPKIALKMPVSQRDASGEYCHAFGPNPNQQSATMFNMRLQLGAGAFKRL